MDSILDYFKDYTLCSYQETATTVNTRLKTDIGSLLTEEEMERALSMCWAQDYVLMTT